MPPSKRQHSDVAPGLYLVATPIGNLGDLSPRGRAILAAADLIACEDSRVSARLLALNGLEGRFVPYHDHSADSVRDRLIGNLKDGKTVALVSDAGMPLISDPGYKLVRAAIDEGISVTCAPGPSAALTALVLSGLPTDRFLFAGFLPAKDKARRDLLTACARVPATLVFFESPRRLAASLAAMAGVLGNRPAAVARELTKLHEEIRRGSLDELAGHYADAGAPKGEVVVVVGSPALLPEAPADPGDIDRLLADALETMSVRDAATAVAGSVGVPRKDVYARALALARPAADDD